MLVVVTALGFVTFVALYHRLTRWWRDPVGQVIMALTGLVATFLVLALSRQAVGGPEPTWWPWVRLVCWLALAFTAWRLPWVFLKSRAAARPRARQGKEQRNVE